MRGSAYEEARAAFAAGGVRDFEADLQDHLRSGFVYAMPGMFVMASARELEDGRLAWLVHHAAGPLISILAVMPYPLPFISLRRMRKDGSQGPRRVWATVRLRRLAHAAYRQTERAKCRVGEADRNRARAHSPARSGGEGDSSTSASGSTITSRSYKS